jgi:hypothetical protein
MLSQLFVIGAVKVYSIVSIPWVTMTEMKGFTKLVVADMVPLAVCEDAMGEPTYMKMDCKRHLSPSSK